MIGAKALRRYWFIFPLLLLVLLQLWFLHVGTNARNEVEQFESRLLTAFDSQIYAKGPPDLQQPQRVTSNGRFAYAFLIAGCDPSRPSYRGFLYNVLVAKHILRAQGSTSDVVLLIRMAANATKSLPHEEERMLKDSGIKFRYLPPPATKETFYSAMMAKFHILNLTEYSRVIYMDADVMPWCNLDYIFLLSEKGIIKDNLVVAWWYEPASGGIFMLKPEVGALNQLHSIVERQQEIVKNQSSWPPFDVVHGWGHEIKPPDHWKTLKGGDGTNWTFQFAFADQGLLYHWVKYAKQSVSIVQRRVVQNWSIREGGVQLEEILMNPFKNHTCPKHKWDQRQVGTFSDGSKTLKGLPFYHDFTHFTGKKKPWERTGQRVPRDVRNMSEAGEPTQLWFHVLRRVRKDLNLSINIADLGLKMPTLGRYPTFHDMANYRKKR